jgi:hypothetical protein
MPVKPFVPSEWNGNKSQTTYTLSGIHEYKPNAFENMRGKYALYSRSYWKGVEERKYIYRLTKKIEYDSK